MQSYGIFARTSAQGCLPQKEFLFHFPILSSSKFLTIIDRTDIYYYLFDGEVVAHQRELAQMVECSLSMQEVLGSIPRFSSH